MKPTWPKKPKRTKHPILGTRQTWLRSDGLAKVERFPSGSGYFIGAVIDGPGKDFRPIFAHVRTLGGAQRACERKL